VILPLVQADPLKDSEDWWEASREGMPAAEHAREYGVDFTVFSGKPVYPEYRDAQHLARSPLAYLPNRPICRGWDIPGPLATVWVQLVPLRIPGAKTFATPLHRLHLLAEMYGDAGVEEYGRQVQQTSKLLFPQATQYLDWADPAAWAEVGHDKRSAADILRSRLNITLQKGAVDHTARQEAVRRWLGRMAPVITSEPPGMLQIDPSCVLIRDGFKSGYHYQEIEKSGRYKELPAKNEYSHLMNALEYVLSRLDAPDTPAPVEAEPLEFTGYLGGFRR
jgi:hypothetical protein